MIELNEGKAMKRLALSILVFGVFVPVAGAQQSPPTNTSLPLQARPALVQRLETVSDRIQATPLYMAVLGHECPQGWTPRKTTDGKTLYVPLGLLVDEDGTPQTPYTLLVACVKGDKD